MPKKDFLATIGVPSLTVNHTLRLVVFDEAFNQMDAEKVKISLDLIRQLKLQAIVVAPNDKMQNYIESAEKTFIFNNMSNNDIEIVSFEKEEILKLVDM